MYLDEKEGSVQVWKRKKFWRDEDEIKGETWFREGNKGEDGRGILFYISTVAAKGVGGHILEEMIEGRLE